MTGRTLVLTALLVAGGALAAAAAPGTAPVTPATAIHGLPGNNPAYGGSSAKPTGGGVNGGNGIHDIGDNPAFAGYNPAADDTDPAQSMHGGLDATTGRPTHFSNSQ
jgi:hypothetical protein